MMRHIHQKFISLVKCSAPWPPGEEYKPEDISSYGGIALGHAPTRPTCMRWKLVVKQAGNVSTEVGLLYCPIKSRKILVFFHITTIASLCKP